MEDNGLPEGSPPQGLARIAPQVLRAPDVLNISPEEVPDLRDYLRVILARRWTVLSSILIVFSTIAIGTLKQKPLYEATVLLEIIPEQPNVLNFKDVLQISTADVDSYRETQYEVLRSRTIAERVVEDLQLYRYPEFYRDRMLLGLIEKDPAQIPTRADPNPPDPASKVYRNSVKHFLASMDVSPVRRSNLVHISFFSPDRQGAARIANQLASDYIDQNLKVKWDEAVKASEWLSGQLVGLKAKLEKSEDALQAYAQRNSILFVEEKKNLANTRLEQLQLEYTKAQAERFQKEALYNLVQAGKVQDLPGFLSNRLIQDLAVRLAELERDYSQLTATVKPDFPKAVALKKQIDTLRASLDRQKKALAENIVQEYQAAASNERYLARALEQQKKEVNGIAEKSITYNILKREVDTNKQLYEGLLQRLKEAQVSAGLKASNVRIVDAAEVPERPVKPRVVLNLLLGLILGAGLGIGLALFQDYLDNTLKTPDEVESLLRLPSLGVVPSFSLNGAGREENKLVSVTAAPSHPGVPSIQKDPVAVEAFRSLRTSILLSAKPLPRVILITSALPAEGKTVCAINLGATLASLGNKVLIVDCDMRRPSCHRSTGVENRPGIVSCLTGQAELAAAILPVPAVPNLNVIPCGPVPPNPAEILSSRFTAEILRKLCDEFEFVLLDSPPLLSVSDSRILATVSDGVVLVVRAYTTPHEAVRHARALLYGAGARILGVALNDVDFHRASDYGYGHYYRYGSGYRDSQEEGDQAGA
jgi:capsular exopolysaccharide synthesis family protein